jgi:4'-phosphopantetheinyl transferase
MLQQRLCFNLSHSKNLVLYAFSSDREVGVDLEYIDPACDTQQLVQEFFSPFEKAEWETLPPDQRLEAFFTGWTRKEAYLKALGDGLTFPLDQFSVSMNPSQPATLMQAQRDSDELSRWLLQTLHPAPAPGFTAAVAVEGQACRILQARVGKS